ncbi:MAG: Smr/MutS family protein [Vicinamibacterales bacterium]
MSRTGRAVAVGDTVQTPLGKGVVRDARKNGRTVVEIQGRTVIVDEHAVTPLDRPAKASKPRPAPAWGDVPQGTAPGARGAHEARRELDLHGLTVEEALARAELAINDALLADLPQLRLIHGRSGGRIRAALHRRLRDIPSVRAFRLDPANDGVTIVSF